MIRSYVAIGDSFTEGLGDPRADGSLRGWADRVAEGLALNAASAGESFRYANLAIRGRKMRQIMGEQIGEAIALRPDLISFNAGGNDILRPNFRLEDSVEMVRQALGLIRGAGIKVLLLAGPDPSEHLPLGRLFHRRAAQFTQATGRLISGMNDIVYSDNFNDFSLRAPEFWAEDGLHLARGGHMKVAMNTLGAMGIPAPPDWDLQEALEDEVDRHYGDVAYYKDHVAPWVKRRLTGKSSGDGRLPKRPRLEPFS